MRDSIHLIIALDMCKVKAGNFGKLVKMSYNFQYTNLIAEGD